MSIGYRTLENPSAECPRTFIPGDECPGTLISGGHPSLLHRISVGVMSHPLIVPMYINHTGDYLTERNPDSPLVDLGLFFYDFFTYLGLGDLLLKWPSSSCPLILVPNNNVEVSS